jgi:glycogen(starch) synthase
VKILQVCHRYWPARGGAERYVQESSERLARDGHEVIVYTTDALDVDLFWRPAARRMSVESETHNGVQIRRFRVRHLPLHFPLTLGLGMLPSRQIDLRLHPPSPLVPDLFRADADAFDVVHTSSLPYNSILFAGYLLARRSGARLLTTPHVHIGEPGSPQASRIFMRPAQRWLLAQSDIVVTHTAREADYLVGRGLESARVRVVACGINPPELEGGDGARFRARHALHDEPLVVYVGTRAFDKGTLHLVQAMRGVWSAGVEARLVLAGTSLPHFRRFWRRQPVEVRRRTLLLDDISDDEKRELLAAAQVFAMPSRSETFGIVFLEAWLYGMPVIGANAGGIPDVIADGEDGVLVPFGDIGALTTQIRRLLDDPALCARLGSNGRRKTLTHCTWDGVYGQIRDVYRDHVPSPR